MKDLVKLPDSTEHEYKVELRQLKKKDGTIVLQQYVHIITMVRDGRCLIPMNDRYEWRDIPTVVEE